MYVCICNSITERQIRNAAEEGASDLWRLQAELGVATGCGSCKEAASEILAEYRARARHAGDKLPAEPRIYAPAMA